MKVKLFVLFGFVSLNCFAQQYVKIAKDSVLYNQQIADMLELVDTNRILSDVEFLSSFNSRDITQPGNDTAAEFITTKMQQYNVNVVHQELNFEYDTLDPNVNVIGIKTGVTFPDSFIVVSAHFDSYSNSENAPGADDNASGVAGMLEILRILDTVDTKYSIMFCAFNAEEWGWQGSTRFVDSAVANGLAIKFDLNIDMIGYSFPVDSHYIVLCTGFSYDSLAERYRSIAAMYVPQLSIPGNFSHAYYFSDQKSFIDSNIPALSFFENYFDENPYVHSDADIIGTSFNSLEKARLITQANLAFLLDVAAIDDYTDLEEKNNSGFYVFPNPVKDKFIISGIEPGKDWSIIDVGGNTLLRGIYGLAGVDVSALSPGVYIIRTINQKWLFIKAN